MELNNILTKYNYNNVIQEKDNNIGIKSDYKTTIILLTNHTKK